MRIKRNTVYEVLRTVAGTRHDCHYEKLFLLINSFSSGVGQGKEQAQREGLCVRGIFTGTQFTYFSRHQEVCRKDSLPYKVWILIEKES